VRTPAAASDSASPSFAQVTPIAPAASWRCTTSAHFGVLKCGRSFAGRDAKKRAMAAMLRSMQSRSTTSAGVSISGTRMSEC
jgi:hypothetical protein